MAVSLLRVLVSLGQVLVVRTELSQWDLLIATYTCVSCLTNNKKFCGITRSCEPPLGCPSGCCNDDFCDYLAPSSGGNTNDRCTGFVAAKVQTIDTCANEAGCLCYLYGPSTSTTTTTLTGTTVTLTTSTSSTSTTSTTTTSSTTSTTTVSTTTTTTTTTSSTSTSTTTISTTSSTTTTTTSSTTTTSTTTFTTTTTTTTPTSTTTTTTTTTSTTTTSSTTTTTTTTTTTSSTTVSTTSSTSSTSSTTSTSTTTISTTTTSTTTISTTTTSSSSTTRTSTSSTTTSSTSSSTSTTSSSTTSTATTTSSTSSTSTVSTSTTTTSSLTTSTTTTSSSTTSSTSSTTSSSTVTTSTTTHSTTTTTTTTTTSSTTVTFTTTTFSTSTTTSSTSTSTVSTTTTTTSTTSTTSSSTATTTTTSTTTTTTTTTTSSTSTLTTTTTTTSTSTVSTTTSTLTTSTSSTSTVSTSSTTTSSASTTTTSSSTSTSSTTSLTTSTSSTSTSTVSTTTTTTVTTTTATLTTTTRTTLTLSTTSTSTGTTSSTTTSASTTTSSTNTSTLTTTTLEAPTEPFCTRNMPSGPGVDARLCWSRRFGDTCIVYCFGDYEGDPALYTCGGEGNRFLGTGPYCTRRQCTTGLPEGFDTSNCMGVESGGWCAVACPSGSVQRASQFECRNNGKFYGTPPACQPLVCAEESRPSGPGVDAYNCSDLIAGENCTATCKPGYSGTSTEIMCGNDGLFHGATPECEPMPCAVPSSLSGPNVTHTCQDPLVTHSGKCMVQCADGFEGEPQEAFCVEATLEFPPFECTSLPCTTNHPQGVGVDGADCLGKVTGETCVPSCLEGFEHTSAPVSLLCGADGAFHGSDLVCRRRPCADAFTSENGSLTSVQLTCEDPVAGDTCLATCADGYDLLGTAKPLQCDDAGDFWEVAAGGVLQRPVPPTCVGRVCTNGLPQGQGLQHDCDGKATGETCTVSAAAGFVGGPFELQCGPSGAFEGPELLVEPVECAALSPTARLADSCANKTIGMTCWSYCDSGYIGSFAQYMCTVDGFMQVSPGPGSECDVMEYRTVATAGGCPDNDGCHWVQSRLECGEAAQHLGLGEAEPPQATGARVLHCGYVDGLAIYTSETDVTDDTELYEQCLGEPGNFSDGCICKCARLDSGSTTQLSPSHSRRLAAEPSLLARRRLASKTCGAMSAIAAGLEVPGAAHNCLGRAHGEVCLVECAHGYSITGLPVRKLCLHGVLVNPGMPVCTPLPCSVDILDGTGVVHNCTGTQTGETCTATCDASGYTYALGDAPQTLTCAGEQQLEGRSPLCIPAPCEPALPEQYRHSCKGTVYGQDCLVDCARGWSLVGSAQVFSSCSALSNFSGELPSCSPNPCASGWPVDADLDVAGCHTLSMGQTCTVSCAVGYTGASTTFTCGAEGSLSGQRPTCTPHSCTGLEAGPDIVHTCEGVPLGRKCSAHCSAGFQPLGAPVEELSCVWQGGAAVLQGQLPQCEAQPCTENFPRGPSRQHDCDGVLTGDSCNVTCSPGYEGSPATLHCDADGALSGTVPQCEPLRCGSPSVLLHMAGNCADVAFGESCTAHCAEGYSAAVDVEELVCGLDASQPEPTVSLHGSFPKCVPTVCVYNIPNGVEYVHNCSRIETGATCVTGCAEDWEGIAEVLTCQPDGSLAGRHPMCLAAAKVLQPVLAQFTGDFGEVIVHFSQVAHYCVNGTLCSLAPLEAPCGELLHNSTLGRLGSSPTCTWSSNRRALHVRLGSGALLEPSETVLFVQGALAAPGQKPSGSILGAAVERGSGEPAAVVVALEALPQSVRACGVLVISAAGSTGGLGRDLRFEWSLGHHTPSRAKQLLQPALEEAGNGPILAPRSEHLAGAYSFLVASVSAPLEVHARVSNWLGQSAEATIVVEVMGAAPVWQMASALPAVANFDTSEPVEVAVRLLPPSAACWAANVATHPPTVTWQYRAGNTEEWSDLEAAGLTATATVPTMLRFAPFTFAPGSQHELQAVAPGLEPQSFVLQVAAQAAPTVVARGPRHISASCGFGLDASASEDSSGDTALDFAWSCSAAVAGTCGGLAGDSTGPILNVPAGVLPAGSYTFEVTVSLRGANDLQGRASVVTDVLLDGPPFVVVTSGWRDLEPLRVPPAGPTPLFAVVRSSSDCAAGAQWHWAWALADTEAGMLVQLLASHAGEPPPALEDFQWTGLLRGHRYAFILLGSFGALGLEQLQMPMTLADLQANGVLASPSPEFIVDGPPLPGALSVVPPRGEALARSFSLTNAGWADESPGELTYAFYRFPADGGLADDAGTALPALPEIDWQNRSSSRYWRKLGGVLMRPWTSPGQAMALGLAFPPGAHYVVARARDSLGATGDVVTSGPVVDLPQAGMGSAASAAALQRAAAEPHPLLDAASALVAIADASVAQLALGALREYFASSPAGGDELLRLGPVIESAVSSSEAPGLSLLRQAADLAGSIVAGAVLEEWHDAVHPTEDSLEFMLAGVHALGYACSTNAECSGVPANETNWAAGRILEAIHSIGAVLLRGCSSGEACTLGVESFENEARQSAALSVAREPAVTVAGGTTLFNGRLVVPPNATSRRRLTGSCGGATFTLAELSGYKLFRFFPDKAQVGSELKALDARGCGALPLEPAEPLQMRFAVPRHRGVPVCVQFNESTFAWSRQGVSLRASTEQGFVNCLFTQSRGTFALAFEAVPETVESARAGVISLIVILLLIVCASGLCLVRRHRKLHGHMFRNVTKGRGRFEDEDDVSDMDEGVMTGHGGCQDLDPGINEAEHTGIGDLCGCRMFVEKPYRVRDSPADLPPMGLFADRCEVNWGQEEERSDSDVTEVVDEEDLAVLRLQPHFAQARPAHVDPSSVSTESPPANEEEVESPGNAQEEVSRGTAASPFASSSRTVTPLVSSSPLVLSPRGGTHLAPSPGAATPARQPSTMSPGTGSPTRQTSTRHSLISVESTFATTFPI